MQRLCQTASKGAAMRLAGAFDAARWLFASCCCCWLLVNAVAPQRRMLAPRYLVYPQPGGSVTKVQLIFGLGIPMDVEVSTIVGYVMKCNYKLPYNASDLTEPYVRRERSDYADINEARMERDDIYQMIETAISSGSTLEGKPCLLRAICAAAATPLNTRHGVFSHLLHLLLTPSSTREPIDQQYLAAERMGRRDSAGDERLCEHAFPECRANFLEYFSEIH